MSRLSEQAEDILTTGDVNAAGQLAADAVHQFPLDWHGYFILGQCFRYTERFSKAIGCHERAYELNPHHPPILLALAIARQYLGDLKGAVEALRIALEMDPEYVLAYNSLGMTQKLMGEYDKAIHNYDAGIKVLTRVIAEKMINDASNPRYPLLRSRHDLWLNYVIHTAVYLSAKAGMESFSFPTGEIAEEDDRTHLFKGLFWQDSVRSDGKTNRFFCPNYDHYFSVKFREDRTYSILIGNRSTVLGLMGEERDSAIHAEEAEDFSNGAVLETRSPSLN